MRVPPSRFSSRSYYLWWLALWVGALLAAATLFWLTTREGIVWRIAGTSLACAAFMGALYSRWALLDLQEHMLRVRARAVFNDIVNERRPFVVYGRRGYTLVLLLL